MSEKHIAEQSAMERRLVLSLHPATRGAYHFAAAIVLISLVIFAIAVPFARLPLPRVTAFIPAYEAALIVCDLITAALLFGQSAIARSRALVILASGYFFTALTAVIHALSYPGVFAETGLLGGGSQSTAWLYMFWHAGFPIAVIGYAAVTRLGAAPIRGAMSVAILSSAAVVLCLVAGVAMLATIGEDLLPRIMAGNRYTSTMIFAVAGVWSLCIIALAALFAQRPLSLLNLWLMVVLCAWLIDVALSAGLNAARFDLGFYVGRIYGLSAASFLLVVLLLESVALYARFARSMESEREERERRLGEMRSELIHVSRLSELGQMVSALAHEVKQPLAAINNYIRASERLMQLRDLEKAQTALSKAAEGVARANDIIQRLRNFVTKSASQKRAEDLGLAIEETIALVLAGTERRDVTIDSRLDPPAITVFIDKIEIQQVLLNLIRNGIEAMEGIAQPRLLVTAVSAPPDMVEVSVADNGPGLSPEVREKLFRPFVTTKTSGMGVGLSICRSIIDAHGGRLWAEDSPDGGTVFKFTVPHAQPTLSRDVAA